MRTRSSANGSQIAGLGLALLASVAIVASASAQMTPESPEVRELVKKGFKYLDANSDVRLGGQCVIALAYLKDLNPQPNHPRVKEALAACRAEAKKPNPQKIDMYSNGLAIIFLCELDPRAHRQLIDFYLNLLMRRQKGHGGWGYNEKETGDTSQTQYAALSLWEAHNNGIRVDSSSAAKLTDWLIHTQTPEGGWGYQGKYSPKPTEQEAVNPSMVAAAMGSSLISLDLFGGLSSGRDGESESDYSQYSPKNKNKRKRAAPLRSSAFDRKALLKAINHGDEWMSENYKDNIGRYNVYYLYSTERFRSFQEQLVNDYVESPEWYQKGYEYLKEQQKPDGSWSAGCGAAPDTAFAILFLIRSTQRMLNEPKGGSRFVMQAPNPMRKSRVENGRLVTDEFQSGMDNLLDSISDAKSAELDKIASNPTALLITGEMDEAAAQRIRQLVRTGEPAVRRLAVRTLGRTGQLDEVPILIYGMTDPDPVVVIEARDALRFISRKFNGFGLERGFKEGENFAVADRWKQWYLSLRPDGLVPLN